MMKTILSLWCLLLSPVIWSQPIQPDFAICAGGNQDEYAADAATTSDNGVIVAGTSGSSSSGDILQASHGGFDMWIARYDQAGQLIWSLLVGGSAYDAATGVVVMPAGEVFVSGYSHSSDGDFPFHIGSSMEADPFVLKISPTGVLISVISLGQIGDDRAVDLVAAGPNRIAVLGYHTPSISEGDGLTGDRSIWLTELDGNGNEIWTREYGGPDEDTPQHLALSPDGGFVFSGRTGSYSTSPGDMEVAVWKTTPAGIEEWVVDLGSDSPMDEGNSSSISITQEGTVRVGFTTTGMESDGVNCTPHGSFMVAEISEAGEYVNVNCYGGTAEDRLDAVLQLDEFHIWLFGTTRSNDGDIPEQENVNSALSDGWLGRITSQGTLFNSSVYGGSGAEEAISLLHTDDDNLVLVMNTSSSDGMALTQHDDETTDYVTSDVLIVWLAPQGTSGIPDLNQKSSIRTYPNPTDEGVWIEITDSETDDQRCQVVISEISGKVVLTEHISSSGQYLDLSELAAGLYTISVRDQEFDSRWRPIRIAVE